MVKRVIGSTDFKAYYQNLPVVRAAQAKMAEESELNIKTDDRAPLLHSWWRSEETTEWC